MLIRSATDTIQDYRTNSSTVMSEEERRMADKLRANQVSYSRYATCNLYYMLVICMCTL